jgi:hypothetical protein
MSLILVERNAEFDYNVLLAQASTVGSAAVAVIVLDRSATFVTSVVPIGSVHREGCFQRLRQGAGKEDRRSSRDKGLLKSRRQA